MNTVFAHRSAKSAFAKLAADEVGPGRHRHHLVAAENGSMRVTVGDETGGKFARCERPVDILPRAV